MSKHKLNKQLTRGELQQRIRKETLELVTNLNSAPVVLSMGPWQKFNETAMNASVKGDIFTFLNSENHKDSVSFAFDLNGKLVMRREEINGHVKVTPIKDSGNNLK
ncbi:hypothetical protein [Limosilactobacillus panis]|uniref:hypothetical protein n=1 Tax=Limosilactobacillus panis TaxID=47493 RepID=UPI000649F255|nr:hypothetical protein [Limosilactobacillus panis]